MNNIIKQAFFEEFTSLLKEGQDGQRMYKAMKRRSTVDKAQYQAKQRGEGNGLKGKIQNTPQPTNPKK